MTNPNEQNTCCEPSVTSSCGTSEVEVSSCCPSEPTPRQSSTSCCGDDSTQQNSWFSRFNFLLTAWSFIPAILFAVFAFDPEQLSSIIDIALTAFLGTLPYILLAVLMIAYLKASGAENLVTNAFKGRENRMIVVAALFGGLAPFCSCEVIPFIAGLLALGAPVSAVMAFWLSSPLIDPASLMITAGALGWDFAIGKAIAALFLGLLGGFGVKYLLKSDSFKNPLKAESTASCATSCSTEDPYSEQAEWKFWRYKERRQIFAQQGIENALFLIKWLSVAYLLEALLISYVPASLIGSIVGGEGFTPIVIGAFVGMPAYLNSFAAPPLVAGLMEQGMSAGSAMAFMVAGAISSIPAMTAVWSLVKKPIFFAYLSFGVGGAIIFGSGFAFVMSL